jgi:hypothetical protein
MLKCALQHPRSILSSCALAEGAMVKFGELIMELHALIKFNVDFQQPLGGYHEICHNGEPTTNQHHSKKIHFMLSSKPFLL